MAKMIKISCDTGTQVSYKALLDFQGDLKELSEENFNKLSAEITKTGFAFAPHAWKNPDDKKWYLLDGHQRVKTIARLVEQGYNIDKLPIVSVQAKSFKEAKRRVLQASSQYGEMTNQGLYNFMLKNDITFDEIVGSFELPTIDLSNLNSLFVPPNDDEHKLATGSQEISSEQFSTLQHKCPRCGFQFGKGGTTE